VRRLELHPRRLAARLLVAVVLLLFPLASCHHTQRVVILPVVANATGATGRMWRTALTIGAPAVATELELSYWDRSPAVHRTRVVLPPQGGLRFDDLFDFLRRSALPSPAAATEIGYLEVGLLRGNRIPPLAVELYGIDPATGGRISQTYGSDDLHGTDESPQHELALEGLPIDADVRLNLGILNPTDREEEVELRLLDFESGGPIGNPTRLALGPHHLETLSDLAHLFDLPTEARSLGVRVRLTGSRGEAWAYASVLDRRSEGAVFVPATPAP